MKRLEKESVLLETEELRKLMKLKKDVDTLLFAINLVIKTFEDLRKENRLNERDKGQLHAYKIVRKHLGG